MKPPLGVKKNLKLHEIVGLVGLVGLFKLFFLPYKKTRHFRVLFEPVLNCCAPPILYYFSMDFLHEKRNSRPSRLSRPPPISSASNKKHTVDLGRKTMQIFIWSFSVQKTKLAEAYYGY